jgi:hypothetical protein
LRAQRLERGEVDAVQAALTVDTHVNETRGAQDAQVLAGRGLRHACEVRELASLELAIHDELEHLPSSGMRDRVEPGLQC